MTWSYSPLVTIEFRLPSHAEELFTVMSDPKLYEFVDKIHRPSSVQALLEKIESNKTGKSPDDTQHWLNRVIRDRMGPIAGFVQATVQPSLEADIAYSVASTDWGRGLARGAVEKVLSVLASTYGVKTFCIVAESANERSVHLAKQLGFLEAPGDASARHNLSATEVLYQKSVTASL